MTWLPRFTRFRRKAAAPVLDPPGYRRGAPPPPPPARAATPPSRPQVHLMLADGSVEALPGDPDLEARAAYLVRSMIPPAPPPPPAPR